MRPIALVDERFGYIKAVRATEKRNRGSVIWECICDCGNTCYFSAKELKEVKSKSCGCVNPFAKDLKGQVFGRLEVLEITEERQKHGKGQGGSVVWKCKCHGCGSVVNLSSRTLLINDARSCGCQTNSNLKPQNVHSKSVLKLNQKKAAFNSVFVSYKKHARTKNVSWELTKDEAYKLFKSNCYYCGIEPVNHKWKGYKEGFRYNGLDAVDNTKGYYIGNVVPCCKKCNEVKKAMTLREFENYINRLYNYYFVEKKNPLPMSGFLKTQKNE